MLCKLTKILIKQGRNLKVHARDKSLRKLAFLLQFRVFELKNKARVF